MTDFKKQFETERRWTHKVAIMDLYHHAQLMNNKEWKIADTANYFDVSIGQASENIQLAKAIQENPSIELLSRNAALKHIRGKNENVNG